MIRNGLFQALLIRQNRRNTWDIQTNKLNTNIVRQKFFFRNFFSRPNFFFQKKNCQKIIMTFHDSVILLLIGTASQTKIHRKVRGKIQNIKDDFTSKIFSKRAQTIPYTRVLFWLTDTNLTILTYRYELDKLLKASENKRK